jgi:hypothetical protein
LQALFICLPANASPKRDVAAIDAPGVSENKQVLGMGHGAGRLRMRRQSVAAPAPSGAGSSGGGGCSAPTTGNRIEVLCRCGQNCLNPTGDHIGRCDAPCS